MSPSVGEEPQHSALFPEAQNPPRLSRSPHPYHRRSLELPDRVFKTTIDAPPLVASPVNDIPNDYFSAAKSTERGLTTSPSDSGTEADDERPLLRALTAPPLRPRKGLRSAKATDGESYLSPLPTPSLSDERDAFIRPAGPVRKTSWKAEGGVTTKIRSPRSRERWRAIVARRSIEVLLLVALATLILKDAPSETIPAFHFALSLAAAIYTICLIRITMRTKGLGFLWNNGSPALLLPDPAISLYPLVIPVLIAVAVTDDPTLAGVNLVLGLCALPNHALPVRSFHIHWAITILPYWYLAKCIGASGALSSRFEIYGQTAVYLFPLHEYLKSCLKFLTSTSLLSTELELLSIGLINLLLFADSPQTYILKSLLWVGGTALFVSCKNVLRWTVSLARVPSWKFRKISRSTSFSRPILTALDDALGGWLSSTWLAEASKDSSDSEDNLIHTLRRSLTKPLSRSRSGTSTQPRSASLLRPGNFTLDNDTSLTTSTKPPNHIPSRRRRHTLPTTSSALYDLPELSRTATRNLAKFRDQSKYFPSLTNAQANILKWIYASFVYFMVVLIILVPIRLYVSYRALQRHEPIGWALGYVLGGQDWFRHQVQRFGLEEWICLEDSTNSESLLQPGSLRSSMLEPANIRLCICAYCIGCIITGLLVVLKLSKVAEVDTRRKVFHGMMVLMFGVTTFVDPAFISLALMLVLAIFLLLDLFRAGQLPPISRPLTIFLAPYVDGRDHKGPVVISPIFLLIGCAIPLWFSLGIAPRTGEGAFNGWEMERRDIGMVTGVVCVGMGDAAASLIGRRFGRRRWPWGGGKSLEGSAAFAVAVVAGLMTARLYLCLGPWSWTPHESWWMAFGKATVAALASSLTETVLTGANDNVLVPVALWLWVRALKL